ncbi:Calx-beta domain-containing protein [Niveispirillum sp.]|uniref:Calx-beta domain-containing protein n=1 Tax=Niveispirillum sp. TaxID=1917217 RepID=UPI001B48F3DA|nr:Calx-beta domain-containing protein [Niveispirillum sp.]MBP7336876.1 hypothetical protein [Niveispirillum sp.]
MSIAGGGSVVEGAPAVFTLSLGTAMNVATDIELSLAHVTTAAGDIDPTLVAYTDPSNPEGSALTVVNGRFTLPAGVTTVYVKAATVADQLLETPESFTLTAGFADPALKYADGTGANPALRPGASVTHAATITDPLNSRPDMGISGPSSVEEGADAVFTLTLGKAMAVAVEVDLALADITTSPGDVNPTLVIYTDPANPAGSVLTVVNGRFTLPAGVTTVYVKAATNVDTLSEAPENFSLTASFVDPFLKYADGTGTDPAPRTGASATGVVALMDAVPVYVNPTLSVTGPGAEVSEGSAAVFKVALNKEHRADAVIDLSVTHVTTQAGDLEPTLVVFTDPSDPAGSTLTVTDGRFTLPKGVKEFYVRAATVDDLPYEGPEQFSLTVAFGDPEMKYADGTGNSPQLRVGASVTQSATIIDDGSGTPYDPVGQPVTQNPVSDDDRRTIAITSPSINEGASHAVFTVSLSRATSESLTFTPTLSTTGTGVGHATPGTDIGLAADLEYSTDNGVTWVAASSGVTLAPGSTSVLVRVPVINDDPALYEGPESFNLVTGPITVTGTSTPAIIMNPEGVTGVGTIYDDGSVAGPGSTPADDDRPTISVDGTAVLEDAGYALFTVRLSSASGVDVVFTPTLGGTITPGSDTGTVTDLEYYDAGTTTWRSAAAGVTIAAGATSVIIRVPVVDDLDDEATETLLLGTGAVAGVSNPGGATGTGTITDNDPSFAFQTQSVTVTEGQAMDFVVQRVSGLGTAVTLNYSVLVSSTDSSTLPVTRTGTVSFTADQSQATISLASVNDSRVTDDQRFYLSLSTTDDQVWITQGTIQGTVRNDDAEISIQSITATGPGSDGLFTYTVTLARTNALGFSHAVDWTVTGAGENPAAIGDFTLPASQHVVFAANSDPSAVSDTQTFTFQAAPGLIVNGERAFNVQIAAAGDSVGGVVMGRDAARGTITPTGAAASIEAVTTSRIEGSDPTDPQTQTFRVTLSQAMSQDVVVEWRVQSFGSGTPADANAADFGGTFPTGTVTIAAGQTSALINFAPSPDSTVEPNEKFYVDFSVLSGPAGKVGPAVLGRILNDEASVGFAFPTVSGDEGDAGSNGHLTATVVRADYIRGDAHVDWHVEPLDGVNVADILGYFAAGQDVSGRNGGLPSGTVTITTGNVQADILMELVGNNIVDPSRYFRIVLDNPAAGTALGSVHVTNATILDDDAYFEMGAATLVHEEGQTGGTSIIEVVVNRVGDARLPASVNWSALGSGANPTNALDLQPGNGTGTVLFGAGESTARIQIHVRADDNVEPDEQLTVTLTGTTTPHHTLTSVTSNLSTQVTLTNDDASVSFDGGANLTQSMDEDGAGPGFGGAVFTFTVTRSGDTRQAVSVPWSIPLSGDLTAADFDAVSGTVNFAVGASTATITVRAVADLAVEGDESFSVVLAPVAGGGVSLGAHSTATGTLVNDDVAIQAVLVSAASEGAGGATSTYTYTLSRVGDTTRQASDVNWSVAGTSVVSGGVTYAEALSAGEFASATSGNLTWAAGDTSTRTVTVTVNNDTDVEGDEAFALNLTHNGSDRSNLLGDGLVGVVHDDDATVSITRLSPAAVPEGAAGTSQTVSFRVTRTGDLSSTLTVDLTAVGGTGPTLVTFSPEAETATISFGDGRPDQVVQILGGDQSVDVSYTVQGDDILEVGENITVTLSNPVATPAGGRVADTTVISPTAGSASVALTNDDDKITVTAAQSTVTEGDSGTTPVTFTLTRTGDTTKETIVNWRALPGTGVAVNADDFAGGQEDVQVANNGLPSGRVTFAAGQTSATVTVNVLGDVDVEGDENFLLNLVVVAGNTELTDTPVTILTDDVGYSLVARTDSVVEGNDPSTPRYIIFDLTRDPGGSAASVNWALSGGILLSDIAEIDIDGVSQGQNLSGSHTFTGSQISAVVRVKLVQDAVGEATKTATLTVTDPSGTPAFNPMTASVSLIDDDAGLSISAGVSSIGEGTDSDLTAVDTRPAGSNEDYRELTFTVARTGKLTQVSTVDWTVLAQAGVDADDFVGGVLPSGSLTFAEGETSKTITMRIVSDWKGEADEDVTVQLSNPSTGTGLITATAITTVTNDDAEVGFTANLTEATALSQMEGDSGYVTFSFTVTRTGVTTQAHEVSWRLKTETESGVTVGDFYDAYYDDPSSQHRVKVLPYGTVSFAAGETSKTIEIKVNSDTFAASPANRPWPPEVSSGLEQDEPFTVELFNPATKPANAGVSVAEDADIAHGIIVNDDVRIQIVSINTSLPEGRVPTSANGYDVNPFVQGQQDWVTHTVVVKRMGDLSQAVSFEWFVDEPNFASQMVTAVTNGVSSGSSGILSWAAGDGADKVLYFTAIPDDTPEADYGFDIKVRPNSSALAESARIDEFSVGDDTISTFNDTFDAISGIILGSIVVKRDEAEVWISNDLYRAYDPETSRYDRFGEQTFKTSVTEVKLVNQELGPESNREGTVITAEAASDYTATIGSLSFDADHRTRTVTVNVNRDNLAEQRETFSLFLDNAANGSVGSDQTNVTIIDGDGTDTKFQLNVVGSTAIEGLDTYAQFRLDFGATTTQTNVFQLGFSGSAMLDAAGGKAGDYFRYVQYSTDGGATWISTAPALEFDYVAAPESTSRTQAVQYQFSNAGPEQFANWLDFTDLKEGQGYKVGGAVSGLLFNGTAAPPLDTSGRIYVVLESDGAWIDVDNDGVKDDDETTMAFDSSDLVSTFTNWGGDANSPTQAWRDLVNLAAHAVTIRVNDLPTLANNTNILDLRQFGEDDEIIVDLKALAGNGYATGTTDISVTTDNIFEGGVFTKRDQTVVATASRNGTDYTTTLFAHRWAYSDYAPTEHYLSLQFGTSPQVIFGDFGLGPGSTNPPAPSNVLVDASGFTGQVSFVSGSTGGPLSDVWIPVRADAQIDTSALGIHFGQTETAGTLKGGFVGVADLLSSNAQNTQALEYFRTYVGDPNAELSDIQTYFRSFDSMGIIDAGVKFLHFTVEWDGTGAPTWDVTGLDAAVVVAPQDGNWLQLQMQQDINVAANTGTTAADIQLNDRAAYGEGANSLLPIPPAVGTLTGSGTATWDGTIKVGPGVDSVLVRTAIANDTIDEMVEQINVTASVVSGDDFTVPYGSGTVVLVDDDSPQITVGAGVVYDQNTTRHYLTQTIDINNRSGDTPVLTVNQGFYLSGSQENNAGTDQAFTIVLRYQGQWEAAPISEVLSSSVEGAYNAVAYQHSSPPAFKALNGTREVVNGVDTGFYLYEMNVPAGTLQIMMRSQVETPASLTLEDLTEDEQARAETFTATVGHVDPVIVARATNTTEANGQAVIEVVAVGGDFANGAASVDYGTVDGAWVEHTFVVSRELATVGSFTLQWEVESPTQGDLPAGAGDGEYVNAYYPNPKVGPTEATDFIALGGQSVTSRGVTGTVTFAEGQKEAYITVRVRSDDLAEVDKDFRVKLLGEVIDGTLVTGAFESARLVSNPENPDIYKQSPLSNAGYGRIANDDRTFSVMGMLVKEGVSSVAVRSGNTWASGDGAGLGVPDTNGALAAQGLTAPPGYSLHQFVVTLEGSGPGAASVDWSIVVNGIDGNGGFIEDGTSSQAAGAHRAETVDFLLYDGGQGSYDSALGLTWGTPNGSEVWSAAKTLYFAEGVKQKVVTIAIRDDLLAEDAEEFQIVLSNPVALEGSYSPVGIDALRGTTKVLIADNDGTTVKVDIGWKDGVSGTLHMLTRTGDEITEGTGSTWDFADAAPTSPATDDDKRIVLVFTRSAADATASQAFFEINFGSAAGGGRSGYVVESGNIAEVKPELWRGIVDFAAGATEARVVLRVADDNLVEEDNNLTVTLYDAEYFPTTSEGIRLPWAGTLGWDTVGFGAATGLADWNTTRRDPDAYTATVRVMEDDVRLWFKEFIKSGVNITTYSFDDDRDTSTPDVDLSLWDPRVRVFEGDSAWSGASDQHASANNGDFSFAIDRTGNLNGNLSLSWEVVLDGTATADDFNAALFSGSYVDGNGHTHLVGATPVTVAERTMGATLTIAGLFAPDLTVENDETFHLVFKNPVSSAGDKVLFSPNPEHENDFDARDGRFQGRDVMTVGVTIANDDVVYSVAWNSQNSTGEVLEADPTASSPNVLKFDVTRVVDAGNDTTDGYIGASSVNWRVVPRNGSDITPADFFDTFTKDGQTVLPYGTVNFSPRDTNSTDDILKTVELRIRGDAVVEFGEHFTIELYNPSIGHIDQAAASVDGVIINDDTGLRVENVSVAEGDSGDQAVTVTVTRVGDLIRAGKPVADQITKFNWSVVDIDTNGDDRGTGSFSGTGVEMGDGQGETTTLAVVHGYAEETTTLTFNVKGDATIEADETLKVLLDNVTGIDQVLNNGSGIVTVLNDDTEFSVVATPTYETANNAVVEDAGGTYHFRITRSVSTPQDQTVTWSVVGSGGRNVVDAADFGGTLPSGQVTFTAGELYKDITFSAVSSDGVAEADEVFLVEVTAFGTGAENDLFVTTGTGAKGTIINDDASVFISDSYPITQVEGTNSDVRMYRFEVVRAGSTQPGTSTINWALDFTGMGADASDFTGPTSGTLTFTQDGAQLVEIAIAADSVAETTLQDFNILLSNGSGSTTILTPSVKGIIGDDDYVLSIANASVAEGDGNNSLVFTVTRTGSDSLPAPVSWALDFAGKTASADDFRATSGTFTIPAGVTTYTFTVPVQGDTQWEDDETFTINLDYGTGTASATGTLTNDDEGFSLAEIDDVKENDGAITFRINREGNLTGTSAVTWTITGSGANAASTSGNDNDFTSALTGTVNFADNQTYVDVTVNLATDTQWEPDETYTVTLSSPSAGSSIKSTADGSRTGTILNDDQGYGVSVDVSQITENQTGGNVAVFTITRALGTGASTVKWTLSKLSGDADAVALGDLLIDGQAAGAAAFDGTTLSFANGETSKTVTVSLVGDAVIENPASLRMTLSRDSGDTSSTLITSTADVQVVDDDEKLSLVPLSNPSEAEGNSGLTKISFKVTRTGSAIGDASATVTIAGTGDHPLTIDDIDHIEVGGQTLSPGSLSALLTFADGSMADQLIDIFIKGDTVGEFDERFTVTLSDPVGDTTLDVRTATQTIVNDDPVLELVMATTAVNEGNDNDDRAITFQVRRSGDLSQTATVTWSVQPGTTNPVDADDFGGSLPTGVVIFQAGESVKTVTFVTLGDDVYEPDESFKVVLSNPIGAAILGADSIAGTLSNDDVEVTLVANNTTIIEQHNGQSVTAQFTVTAQGSAASTLVTWHVEGTGLHPTNGADFVSGTLPSGQTTITMNAGIGTATIDIDIAGDDIYGPDEQFRLVIDTVTSFDSNQNPGGGTATVGSATVTVQDDDILIGLSQTETHRYVEDDSGTTEIRFYVDEIQRSANAVTMDHVRVDYHITGEVDGDDITGGSGTDVALSWDAVEERYYIGMSIKGDMQAEGNERFELHLDGARTDSYNGGVEIVPSGARVAAQILDDDFGIGLVSTNLSQAEDGARFVFDVLRTGQVDEALTVQWTLGAPTLTGNQQGVSANDFLDPVTGQPFSATTSTPLTGTLTFNAGQSTARFSLEASHDLVPETDERFAVKVEVTEVGGVPLTANDNQVALLEGVILNDETLPMPFDPAVDHVTHPTLDTVAV